MTVFVNGRRVNGKVIYVPKKWSEFLKVAGRRVSINVVRVFNEDGGELDELDLICNKDVLFVSSGDNFIPPTAIDNQGMNPHTFYYLIAIII